QPVRAVLNPWYDGTTKRKEDTRTLVDKYIELIKSLVERGRLRVVGVAMIDTIYRYWPPPCTVRTELPAKLNLGLTDRALDLRDKIPGCMNWSRQDRLEWVARNWKDNKEESGGCQ
ncbi:hypothetical protein V8F20_012827, partial [Naviculisporaceae sp. PSN 640]